MNATTVVVDLARPVFQIAVADEQWTIVETQRFTARRRQPFRQMWIAVDALHDLHAAISDLQCVDLRRGALFDAVLCKQSVPFSPRSSNRWCSVHDHRGDLFGIGIKLSDLLPIRKKQFGDRTFWRCNDHQIRRYRTMLRLHMWRGHLATKSLAHGLSPMRRWTLNPFCTSHGASDHPTTAPYTNPRITDR